MPYVVNHLLRDPACPHCGKGTSRYGRPCYDCELGDMDATQPMPCICDDGPDCPDAA
jgi:hypothetical protein